MAIYLNDSALDVLRNLGHRIWVVVDTWRPGASLWLHSGPSKWSSGQVSTSIRSTESKTGGLMTVSLVLGMY